MKKVVFVIVLLLSIIAFGGEKIGSGTSELLTDSATELLEKILGENWEESNSRISYFTVDTTKELVFAVAAQTGMMMGAVPVVSDFEGGILVMTTSPNQALSGSIFYSFQIEEATFGEHTTTAVTMKTNKLYYSKYLGWDTDSSEGTLYHKLAALIFSVIFTYKKASYEVIEGVITNPEGTIEKLKDFIENQ
ncbi:hypothetical protein AT15_00010 [Kosmotoga arenicorallina S304]|uniref:Uncharacterized protein n=1 Tax=Kosmotoga arenicorallina S304 TaxID=1453497 RepID=A0A176K498_9BACT|nr:hypothetical protein [Kosmotoga arenicorallina]OAA32497.1 hypothetical protein AT15_00010 [Kosmotoga arenicorallina S304]